MNRGFTLIEVLTVIALLGVLAVIITTTSNRVIKSSKQSLYENQIDTIEEAAKKWSIGHTDEMPMSSTESAVTVDVVTLAADGYLDNDQLTDPRDNTKMCGSIKITYNESKKQYSYQFIERDC